MPQEGCATECCGIHCAACSTGEVSVVSCQHPLTTPVVQMVWDTGVWHLEEHRAGWHCGEP